MATAGDPSPPGRETTLGELLHAGRTRPLESEQDWVELVQAIAKGDQVALHALYVRGHRLVFTLAIRITGSRETAEELTVDVFHDVWRRAAGYHPGGGPVIGWIMNQARSRAIDRVRFEQRKKRVDAYPDGAPTVPPPSSPFETFDAQEQGRLLREALGTLRPEEREAIETAFFSELTYGETAARLNQPLGTVKTRIRSGLSRLRLALDELTKGT